MRSNHDRFEFRAIFTDLDEGLDVLHQSIESLRTATGRHTDDRELMLFETALGEIGGNALTHGRRHRTDPPVEYALRFDGGVATASLTDSGVAVHDHLRRKMPDANSENGRGLAIARELLDELGYKRDGEVNRWRLVRRI